MVNTCNPNTLTATSCANPANCEQICSAVEIVNSWIIPECDELALVSVPGLTNVLIGAYIFHPTYGTFEITAFNSITGQMTIRNNCTVGNAAPGTTVPAYTSFIFSAFPFDTVIADNYCLHFVDNEAALIAANTAGVGQIVVVGNITLTAPLTLTTPTNILPCGSIITNGNILTIDASFSAGLYRVFVTAVDDVAFSNNSIVQVVPQWFGALGNQVNNDSDAINQAIRSLTTNSQGNLHFPAGDYSCESSLNFTMLDGMVISGCGMGSILRLRTSGTVGMDFTGSNRCQVRDLYMLSGSSTTAPSVLVLLARTIGGASAAWHKFENCQVQGPNSGTTCKATFYNYGSEDLQVYSCRFYNTNTNGVGVYVTSDNDLSIVSPFQTIYNAEASTASIAFFGGHVIGSNTAVTNTTPVVIHGSRDLTFTEMGFVTEGTQTFKLLSDGPNQLIDTLNIVHCRCELFVAGPLYTFNGDAANTFIKFGSLIGNIFNAQNAVINEPAVGGLLSFGVAQGNATNVVAPPSFIITAGDVLSGMVDVMGMEVHAVSVQGVSFNNLNNVTDVITSGTNRACSHTTNGSTLQRKLKYTGILAATELAVYANNAAALAGGLVAGDFYRTNANPDPVCVVH